MQQTLTRGGWSSTVGFVLAAIGSAVGLGNVWRFPYITGQYGGAAFIVLYIGCVLAVGLPILLAEFLIGRKTQRNAVGAFRALRPGSPWIITGWLGVVSGFVILSYYSVVGGWVLHYVYLSLSDSFSGKPSEEVTALFTYLAGNPLLQIFWHAIFMLLAIAIVAGGVSRGIERGNKIMMPLLLGILIVLLIYAMRTEGSRAGIDFLLRPEWHKLGPPAVLEALGQALFSLSLGMGAMLTYGSYITRGTHLVRSACVIAAGDTLVALIAGLVIFPLVFTFQLETDAGPGLVFRTLPTIFGQLPGGGLVAIGFFVLLTFAALSSAISLLEVVCAYFIDERGWSRMKTSWMMGGAIFLLGIPSDLGEEFLGFMDGLATNFLLPIGALLIAVFTGWVLTASERRHEFRTREISALAYFGWSLSIRFVSPVLVILIFIRRLGLI